MRCDLHVHSVHSGPNTLPPLRSFCRECYSPPWELYGRLRARGMDLVTVTDHDSIAAADDLGGRFDFFLSEEVTCRLPSGAEAHLAVYDLTARQHEDLQARRGDFPRLLAYLREERLFAAVNHIGSGLTGRRQAQDFDLLLAATPALETRNGHVPAANNRLARALARREGKIALGGSDAHGLAGAGRAWTTVPGARNREEFLAGLRAGKARPGGRHGAFWPLTLGILEIALGLATECPAAVALLPALVFAPLAAAVHQVGEQLWARRWRKRLLRPAPRARATPAADPAAA